MLLKPALKPTVPTATLASKPAMQVLADDAFTMLRTAPGSVETLGCPRFGGGAKLASRYGACRRGPPARLELDRVSIPSDEWRR